MRPNSAVRRSATAVLAAALATAVWLPSAAGAQSPESPPLAASDESLVRAAGASSDVLGDLDVSVGYVVFGSRLHLRSWPLHAGEREDVRIDVWVAPNANDPRLTVFKGDGVDLSGCTAPKLVVGQVNRIGCSMRVPRTAAAGKAHVRLVVVTPQGTYTHSFLVLVA
jgi:hypothetical protein